DPGVEPYSSIFQALATWSSVASTSVNLQYVCRPGDLGISAFDNVKDAGTDLYVLSTHTFALNGFNEILFDDTTNGQMFINLANELGTIDTTSVLAIGIVLDANGVLIPDASGGGGMNTGPIREGFILLNETPATPLNSINLQGTVTHEIG